MRNSIESLKSKKKLHSEKRRKKQQHQFGANRNRVVAVAHRSLYLFELCECYTKWMAWSGVKLLNIKATKTKRKNTSNSTQANNCDSGSSSSTSANFEVWLLNRIEKFTHAHTSIQSERTRFECMCVRSFRSAEWQTYTYVLENVWTMQRKR